MITKLTAFSLNF